jgi:hypothetical protein
MKGFDNNLESGFATALGWALVALILVFFFGNKVSV